MKPNRGFAQFEHFVLRVAGNVSLAREPDVKGTPRAPAFPAGAELRALVAAFLKARPEDERRVYDARYEQGDTQTQAAARLHLNRITVRRVEARLKTAFVRFLLQRDGR
ncbi:MAG: hypothetical protein HY904_07470 [Deltaproteobacteria bacterium]|nr:hypothetical protein [Deltaproteobacteria bacterium]